MTVADALASNYAMREYALRAYLLDTNRQPSVGLAKISTP
jgi:hypothetical protein